ncbi:MAG TPA: acylneuraminate cytidylyltransferase family protein [Anaerolineales bacterium]|nr:acylneuraminate cytidylyltransferase family protein [Anaerolineales bacterium]
MRNLAIIPARGGSKGIPNKNIAFVGGRPLIAWTIQAARSVSEIERVIVSTDSPAIAQVAQQYEAEVPFLRPAELARDETPSIDVVIHLVNELEKADGYRPDYILLLQPTSPLRSAEDIRSALRLAQEKNALSVVSVCPAGQNPYWMKTISKDGLMHPFLQTTSTRRQDLPSLYVPNGAIYLTQREWLLEKRAFYTDQTHAYVMPPERSLDIDEPWDMTLAKLILTHQE